MEVPLRDIRGVLLSSRLAEKRLPSLIVVETCLLRFVIEWRMLRPLCLVLVGKNVSHVEQFQNLPDIYRPLLIEQTTRP